MNWWFNVIIIVDKRPSDIVVEHTETDIPILRIKIAARWLWKCMVFQLFH